MTPLYRLSTYERSSSGTHACLWLASILVLWRRLSGGNHLKPSCRRSRFSMQLRIDAKVVRPSGRAITGQRNVPLSLFRRLPIRKESGGMRQHNNHRLYPVVLQQSPFLGCPAGKRLRTPESENSRNSSESRTTWFTAQRMALAAGWRSPLLRNAAAALTAER